MRSRLVIFLLLLAGCDGDSDDTQPGDTDSDSDGDPSVLVLISGGDQNATVATALSSPIVVELRDNNGNPIEAATLHFVAAATSGVLGNVGANDVKTNASGQSTTTFTLGQLAGDTAQWVEVTVNGFPLVTTLNVKVEADPDEPDNITIISGNNQTASYGQTLTNPLVVYVEDQFANPVWDYLVTWSSTTGTTGDVSTITGANGQTSTSGTLGSTPGVPDQYFTATAGSVDVAFSATATGHYIDRIESWRVWPGYPDTVTIAGAGFDPSNALVVWDVGGTEQVLTPISKTTTEIVFYPPTADVAIIGDYPILVHNPSATLTDCAPVTFEVDYLIPDTGQTQCYNASYEEVACSTIPEGDPLYGQDGHYEVASRQHYYTDHDDETVTDDVTGLMWQQANSALWMNWYEAVGKSHTTYNPNGDTDYCEDLTVGGYDDWRLPTAHELATLVDAGKISPMIDIISFSDTPGNDSWSSSSYANNTFDAWGVSFYYGDVSRYIKVSNMPARCVRSGPLNLGTFDSLTLLGDRVVRDTDTGLTWQGCSAGQSGDACATGSASNMTWQAALAYCEDLNWGGYDDWHLPDRNELQSIVDYDSYNPAIDPIAFPGTQSYCYWSSSSYANGSFVAWLVYFGSGYAVYYGKPYNYYARCVRSGP